MYIELVIAILDRIEHIMDREDISLNADQEVNEINALIDIMKEKNIQPKCKRLRDNTISTNFMSVNENKDTMSAARTTLENAISEAKALVDWNNNNHANSRNKQKDKYQDLWKKWTDLPVLKTTKDLETISEALCTSTYTMTQLPPCVIYQYATMDVPREIIENIPIFDGKPEELNQFLSTINSYATMYNVQRVNLMMLRSRGKAHKIISNAVAEDSDIEWSTISKKLISNYGTIKGNIEANVKLTKLQMNEETLGEYLARARTLITRKPVGFMQSCFLCWFPFGFLDTI